MLVLSCFSFLSRPGLLQEFATWPDKLYEDAGTKNVGDEREVENPALMGQEEKLIVDELRALKKGEMYIHQVKA